MIILIRDLEGGPYKIIPKFIFEFTKEYLSIKKVYILFLPYSSPYTSRELVILS